MVWNERINDLNIFLLFFLFEVVYMDVEYISQRRGVRLKTKSYKPQRTEKAYLRPKSAGTSPQASVCHLMMGMSLQSWVRNHVSARAMS